MKPYVIFRNLAQLDITNFKDPLGVEVAESQTQAYNKAIERWPYLRFKLFPPVPWEDVDVETRLKALKADRKIPVSYLFATTR